MKHRKFMHPDRGKRSVLGPVARKSIQSAGIFLKAVATGVLGAVRVWFEPGRPMTGQCEPRNRRKEEVR